MYYVMGLHKWISRSILLLIIGVFGAQLIWLQDKSGLRKQSAAYQVEERHANSGHILAAASLGNYTSVDHCNCSSDELPRIVTIVSCPKSSSDVSRQSSTKVPPLSSSDVSRQSSTKVPLLSSSDVSRQSSTKVPLLSSSGGQDSLHSDTHADEHENMNQVRLKLENGANINTLNENFPPLVASSIESTEGNTVVVSSVEGATATLSHYLLVVVVLSSVHGRDRRTTIRKTWMKGYKEITPSLTIKFVIGTLGLTPSEMAALTAEDNLYHDLLLLSDLKDGYHNLTRKVLYTFQWADENLMFSYLLKCDDDSYIRLDAIARELNARTSKKGLYWGYFTGSQFPKWSGKFAERKWFLCDRYLPYALGGGYVISSDLIHRVSMNADGVQLYNSEDVSVGVWLSAFQAERKHDSRFDTEWASRGCINYHLVSHKQTIRDMLDKYHSLKSKKVLCSRQYVKRGAYNYNWWVPPSRCCKH